MEKQSTAHLVMQKGKHSFAVSEAQEWAAGKTITIPVAILKSFLEQIFVACGCNSENAEAIAAGVVEADMRGYWTQGTDHIFSIIDALKTGELNGCARPRIIRERPAVAQVDGDGAAGYVAGHFATAVVIDKAKKVGSAVVGVVRGGDLFMLGAYVERIARVGLVGMSVTNGPPRVHPQGGIDAMLGTNPMAFGFPVSNGEPVIIDVSMSTVSVGPVRIASYADASIPDGVAIDENGAPTTNAKRALAGALTPLGGHKGYALALASALLSGPLPGAMLGRELLQSTAGTGPWQRGHLFIAIDPEAFGDPTVNLTRTRRYLDEIKAGRKAVGVEEILIPGERSARTRSGSLENGVRLLETVWQRTAEIARSVGVVVPEVAKKRDQP